MASVLWLTLHGFRVIGYIPMASVLWLTSHGFRVIAYIPIMAFIFIAPFYRLYSRGFRFMAYTSYRGNHDTNKSLQWYFVSSTKPALVLLII